MREIFRTFMFFLIILVIFSYSLLIVYGLEIRSEQKESYIVEKSELIERKEELVNTYLFLENEKTRLQQELIIANNENRARKINQEIANAPKIQTTTKKTVIQVPKKVKKVVRQPTVKKVTTRAS